MVILPKMLSNTTVVIVSISYINTAKYNTLQYLLHKTDNLANSDERRNHIPTEFKI